MPQPVDRDIPDVLPGEGDYRVRRERRVRRRCERCDAPATRKLRFLVEGGARLNPASSAFGRDDCSYCADYTAFACAACEREVERDAPQGMRWSSTSYASERNAHMFLEWTVEETEVDTSQEGA